jgi:hypothetical protein
LVNRRNIAKIEQFIARFKDGEVLGKNEVTHNSPVARTIAISPIIGPP